MSKIINSIQAILDKVIAHKYTGFTIKLPFINFSFAPVHFHSPFLGLFLF